jgi:hypothetical protein
MFTKALCKFIEDSQVSVFFSRRFQSEIRLAFPVKGHVKTACIFVLLASLNICIFYF